MAPLACLTHWYTSLLFAAPVVLLFGWIRLSAWRERRAARRGRAQHVDPTT